MLISFDSTIFFIDKMCDVYESIIPALKIILFANIGKFQEEKNIIINLFFKLIKQFKEKANNLTLKIFHPPTKIVLKK